MPSTRPSEIGPVPTFPAPLDQRRAGVLLHPTSLPDARHGALGQAARSFIDWLVVGGFSVWQVLPLGPVGADRSPYFARSNHAGDSGLIDLLTLCDQGLIAPEDLERHSRAELLSMAALRLRAEESPGHRAFQAFRADEAHWLSDYALYTAFKAKLRGAPWWEWPEAIRSRDAAALSIARQGLEREIREAEAIQFFFHTQWQGVRRYAAERGVKLFGDLPIYLAPDSVETWVHPELFDLDERGRPLRVAGVPPDYFSKEGQLWGNPLYRWEEHARTGFDWWVERLRAQFGLFDLVRIDHFRGLEAYWVVPAGAPNAIGGTWLEAPGEALLARVREVLGDVAIVAEDLGVINPKVERLRDVFGLPGIRVAQFGFDSHDTAHVPYRWPEAVVGYSGTHDNDTTAGWFSTLDRPSRDLVCSYLDVGPEPDAVVPAFVRMVLASTACLAVLPMQDLLGLGSEARMNTPGTAEGNWRFAFSWAEVPPTLGDRLRRWNSAFGRVV
jgi:4-alpha-glucanotransferase